MTVCVKIKAMKKGIGKDRRVCMKNKIHGYLKRIATVLLTGALVLTGADYLPVDGEKTYAKADETVIHFEQMEIADYVNGTERRAPKTQEKGYEEWVFAGWYTAPTCAKEEALNADVRNGTYYAKFVPAGLLSVKCQTLEGTTAEADRCPTSKLRLVATVDNLDYGRVGFEIKMGTKEPFQYDTTTVYEGIQAGDGGVEFKKFS